MAKAAEKNSTGKRYTETERKNIMNYYNTAAKNNPRGAITRTMERYKISYTALKSWLGGGGNGSSMGKTLSKPVNNKAQVRAYKGLVKAYEKLIKVLN